MEHILHLKPRPYALIASGHKTLELRLNDEKRQRIGISDALAFLPDEGGEIIRAEVVELLPYPDFVTLLAAIPMDWIGCKEEHREEVTKRRYTHYSPEQERQFGVLGIRFRLIT